MTITPFRFWLIIALAFIGFLWVFHSVLWMFFIGLILAYVLNPMVDKLQERQVPRLLATNLVMLGFIGFVIIVGALFIPVFINQMTDFLAHIPNYSQKLIEHLRPYIEKEDISSTLEGYIQKYMGTALTNLAGVTKNIMQTLLFSSLSLIHTVTSIVIILVVAFYLLLDWHLLIDKIDSWLPRKNLETIRFLFKRMDDLQSAFMRGQLLVCMCMMAYYITMFEIIRLDYALTLGMATGILTFIPYVGASIGFVITMMVALAQYLPEGMPLIWVACIFAVGQTLEGYVFVPKLVGKSVDMHPVWIMFALMAFGSVFGISGMLIAVPVTAAIGVLAKFMLEHYILSCYYRGNTNS